MQNEYLKGIRMLLQNQLKSILYQLEGVQIVIDDAVIHVNPFLSCRAAIHVIYQVHMRAVGRSVNVEGVRGISIPMPYEGDGFAFIPKKGKWEIAPLAQPSSVPAALLIILDQGPSLQLPDNRIC